MDTTIKSPVKDNSCHSTPNLLASSPDSGIPQSFPHTPLSFQSESPVITSQPTTPVLYLAPLVLILTIFSQLVLALLHARETLELYEIFLASGTESHTSKNSLIFYYLFLYLITKTSKKTRQVIPNKSYAIQRICVFYTFIYLTTASGVSVEIQHLVFLYIYNIWCFCTITTSIVFFIFLKTAMTRKNLLVFIIFLFNSLTKTLEVDNIDNVSEELIVSHYDCTKMQDNRMYSLDKVAECNISPENLYIAPATITLYQKKLSNRPFSNNVFCQGPCISIQLWNVFAYVIRA